MTVNHIAIIGIGSIGRRHLRNLKATRPDIKITLVRSGHGKDWPELKLANHIVYSLEDAISLGIEAAIIASPSTLHIQQSKILVQSGIHLLIEKPLSHNLDKTKELIADINNKNIVVLIGYVLRHDPIAQKFKLLLEDNCLGQLLHVRVETSSYLPDWRPEQNYKETVSASAECGGGVLLELSHEFDYIRWFFGDIKIIAAYLHNSGHLDIDVEECADIILIDKNHLPISLHLDFHARHPIRRCIVAGSKGTATWDAVENKLIWHPANKDAEIAEFTNERDDLFINQLQHFISCIENGDKPLVSIQDGVEALKLVETAKLKHSSNQKTGTTI